VRFQRMRFVTPAFITQTSLRKNSVIRAGTHHRPQPDRGNFEDIRLFFG